MSGSSALPVLPADWPAGPPAPRTRVAPPTPPRLPCIASARNPSELQSFDTRVADILSGRPELLQLLKKHRAVFQNFNQDTVARLGRLLQQSHDSEEALEQQWYFSDSKNEQDALRTVTISQLPPVATQSDVEALFDRFGPASVWMPLESRNMKHVGIAYVRTSDCAMAQKAARSLDGHGFHAARDPFAGVTRICAAVSRCPMEGPKMKACLKTVNWRSTADLWELQMYSKDSPVEDSLSHVAPPSQGASLEAPVPTCASQAPAQAVEGPQGPGTAPAASDPLPCHSALATELLQAAWGDRSPRHRPIARPCHLRSPTIQKRCADFLDIACNEQGLATRRRITIQLSG